MNRSVDDSIVQDAVCHNYMNHFLSEPVHACFQGIIPLLYGVFENQGKRKSEFDVVLLGVSRSSSCCRKIMKTHRLHF